MQPERPITPSSLSVRAPGSKGSGSKRGRAALPASLPAPGVAFTRASCVAATKSAAEPPSFTARKHFTAAAKSLGREEATNPTFGAWLRRNAAV